MFRLSTSFTTARRAWSRVGVGTCIGYGGRVHKDWNRHGDGYIFIWDISPAKHKDQTRKNRAISRFFEQSVECSMLRL